MRQSFVYIMASQRNGTLYTGITTDLIKRIAEHQQKCRKGFTSRYNINLLVWFEVHDQIEFAIAREKQIKNWKRQWKIELIEKYNPLWKDLYESLF